MDKRRILDRLRHMEEAATAAQRLLNGKALAEYSADRDLAAAVERYLERLSEASRHIPDALKARHPGIDWRGVADIGNVLRHAYDQVSDKRVIATVTEDLPGLKAAIEALLRDVEETEDR